LADSLDVMSSRDAKPPCILVADDDASFLTLAAMSLKRSGFDVVSAADGTSAMEALEARPEGSPFDLLVLDILMPGATGWEVLARAVEARPPGSPRRRAS
jgi:CheY-like chemotaxis protein